MLPLSGLAGAVSRREGAPIYYLQGPGCYARILRGRTGGRGLLAPCAAVHRHFRLTPVFERQAPNHGNPVHQELGYYSHRGPLMDRIADGQGALGLTLYDEEETSFHVGLWRVDGFRESGP